MDTNRLSFGAGCEPGLLGSSVTAASSERRVFAEASVRPAFQAGLLVGWLGEAAFSAAYELPQAMLTSLAAARAWLRDWLVMGAAPTRIPFLRPTANQPALPGENP